MFSSRWIDDVYFWCSLEIYDPDFYYWGYWVCYFGDEFGEVVCVESPHSWIRGGKRADEAYQLFEGMVAFGVGGITGKGAANGLQVRSYLPKPLDFVLANIGEEHGFVGTTLVAIAYFGIFWFAYRAMRFSTDLYRLNICLGATLFLVLRAVGQIK
jgi:cell division protein FtsW (lipid II flippase)